MATYGAPQGAAHTWTSPPLLDTSLPYNTTNWNSTLQARQTSIGIMLYQLSHKSQVVGKPVTYCILHQCVERTTDGWKSPGLLNSHLCRGQ